MAETTSGRADGNAQQKRKPNCRELFDVWAACYAPWFQLQSVYRYGDLDDCFQQYHAFKDCMLHGTRWGKPDLEGSKPTHPLWTLRTPAEAAEKWDEEFGHLREQPPPGLEQPPELPDKDKVTIQ